MATVVVSDLHLGTRSHRWLLSEEGPRERLAAAVAGADRLVLLGDVLELRESPLAAALEAATPTLEVLGEAMAGREVVLAAGNHDVSGMPLGLLYFLPPQVPSRGLARRRDGCVRCRTRMRATTEIYRGISVYTRRGEQAPAATPSGADLGW